MKRLLIVVDYQKDFVDGSLGFDGAEKLDARIAEKIASYRATGDEVAFTFDTHHRDYLKTQEGRNLPIEHCVDGTPGHDLYGEVALMMRDSDTVFKKPSFGSVELFERLRASQRTASWWAWCRTSASSRTPSWPKPPAPRSPSSSTPPARAQATPSCTRRRSTSWRACRSR